MSWLCDTTELVPDGWLSSLYPGHGVRGAAVPSTGTDGPSPLFPCLTLPADADVEVRGYVTRRPLGGTLELAEDLSFVYTGAPDYFEFRLHADGPASTTNIGFGPGIVRVSLGVGVVSAFGAGAALGPTVAGGALTSPVVSAFGAGATLRPTLAGGVLAGAVVSAFGSGATLGATRVAGALRGLQVPGAPRRRATNLSTGRRPANLA
jgi:hypothetical protein